jgi:periplasmic divalent cation tolerance protein
VERIWIIVTTVDDLSRAEHLANGAVQAKLAACAQIDSPIQSRFHWQGKLETVTEHRVTFKAGEEKKAGLMDWLRGQHPYETPQILAFQAEPGDPAYSKWVNEG